MKPIEINQIEEAKTKWFELMQEMMYDIQNVRICEFLVNGIETPVIGIIKTSGPTGFVFEPYFTMVTDDVYEDMLPLDDTRPMMIGFREPKSEN
jgi:hypothetical protein